MSTSNTTITSLPSASSAIHIPPSTPSAYLRQVIVQTLLNRGFGGAEAGALAEIERLLERHITNVFEDSIDYAYLSGRREVNAQDLVAAQEESGWGVRRMRKEAKRRRDKAPTLPTFPSPPPSPKTESLASLFHDDPSSMLEDRKPDLDRPITSLDLKGERPFYAEDWVPSLPLKYTYSTSTTVTTTSPKVEDEQSVPPEIEEKQPVRVTSALLDFIKLTATERGDIPPELGVVDYRREAGNASGQGQEGAKKRKWGVKGVTKG
ncbi:hypothetical protein IAR55_005750 [Kwoniella newhampshirensis]|uniref:Transcription initiation factor TFIID subunit 9B n=1 Tax=Kwoniella newhampshirensis TaxID=1651941 RepID=A0AAW0YGA7_9TREE